MRRGRLGGGLSHCCERGLRDAGCLQAFRQRRVLADEGVNHEGVVHLPATLQQDVKRLSGRQRWTVRPVRRERVVAVDHG